jgi:glycosyltransferase involved in cell wall biosynthesis
MLKDSAMKFKSTKKAVFLFFLKRFGLLKSVIFHATDEQERIDIKRIFPKNEVSLVSNIPATAIDKIERQKSIGACKLVFTGRIHPIKGLDVLLEALRNRTEQITLEVIGPAEDKAYEKKCKSIIATFNSNIVVTFKGSLPFHEILKIYKNSHVFILPTMGENFGHAIYEALLSGLPVIISDQTPWRDLREKIVGFDLPLSEKDGFSKAIEFFINMNNEVYNEWSDSARAYANTQIDKKEIKNKYIELFS